MKFIDWIDLAVFALLLGGLKLMEVLSKVLGVHERAPVWTPKRLAEMSAFKAQIQQNSEKSPLLAHRVVQLLNWAGGEALRHYEQSLEKPKNEAAEEAALEEDTEPEWLRWAEENRPFPTSTASTEEAIALGELRLPFQPITPDPYFWSQDELLKFIHLQMGLGLPLDSSRVHITWDGERQLGPVELTDELCQWASEMRTGFDQLHRACLIIAGVSALAVNGQQADGIRAANLLYYAATAACVGPGTDARELEVEAGIRQLHQMGTIRSLQEAVAFIFYSFDLPHPASLEYTRFDHPQIWGW